MLRYVYAYLGGGVASFMTANFLWYPAPDIHGAQLGLLAAGIFLSGSAAAIAITRALSGFNTPIVQP